MSKFQGVYISGTGGTGTTLMRRLFYAFEHTDIFRTNDLLSGPDDLVKRIGESCPMLPVGIRGRNSLFSHQLSDVDRMHQIDVIEKYKIGVIVMVRDYEAASRSRAGNVSQSRWMAVYSDIIRHWPAVHYICNYYRLVAEPDKVQREIAKTFGLMIRHTFSEYPDFLPEKYHKKNYPPSHSLRKIGAPYA